jgi:hypothetical protein
VTRIWAGWLDNYGSISGRVKNVSLLELARSDYESYPASYEIGRLRMHGFIHISTVPASWRHRDNFTCTFLRSDSLQWQVLVFFWGDCIKTPAVCVSQLNECQTGWILQHICVHITIRTNEPLIKQCLFNSSRFLPWLITILHQLLCTKKNRNNQKEKNSSNNNSNSSNKVIVPLYRVYWGGSDFALSVTNKNNLVSVACYIYLKNLSVAQVIKKLSAT